MPEQLLDSVTAAVAAGTAPPPATRLALAGTDDPVLARKAGRALAALDRTGAGELRPVRVSVLATHTIGAFAYLLRAALVGGGALPEVELADYGSFELRLATADLGADGDPDVAVCLLDESYFLPAGAGTDVAALVPAVEARVEGLRELIGAVAERTTATVVLHTVPLPATVTDAVLDWRARARLTAAWYRLNAALLDLAAEYRQVAVVDLVGVLADQPLRARDDRLHRYADARYSDGALLALAHQVRRVVQARLGLSRKVLAVDLDNTLWGGEVGEVGAQAVQLGGLYPGNAYLELQRTVARLREQGVVLVLVSKNDAAVVDEALRTHPEVLLRPDAFSVRTVNWSSKADNLRQAAETLGLSTESFVFVDDSRFELGLVQAELPEVALVGMDGDPAGGVRALLSPGWFDTLELTDVDRKRPDLYRSRAVRTDFSAQFGSSEEYLRALKLELTAEPLSDYLVTRVAQLAARTNQFNLSGIRFDDATTAAMGADPGHLVAAFSVRDRFGDEGLVGAAWVAQEPERWRVRNLVLSCRVLGRGIELAVAAWLAGRARDAGAAAIEGTYVRSAKNGPAADFWTRAGFARTGDDGVFTLDLRDGRPPAPEWITTLERNGA